LIRKLTVIVHRTIPVFAHLKVTLSAENVTSFLASKLQQRGGCRMAEQTVPSERRRYFERYQAGQTYEEIAALYGRSMECVRYWCRRQRDGGSVETKYHRSSAGLLSRFDPKVRYVILRLRLEHPRWGPHSILLHLEKRPSLKGERLPSPAAIGRYISQWKRLRRPRRPHGKRRSRPNPATAVHQRWQVDFKERVKLEDGTAVHLHTSCDPVATFFIAPPRKRIRPENVRAFLRTCFARWGTLPQEIQTDGEPALVGRTMKEAFPSSFTLWLKGLDIEHLVTRHGRPTDNSEVERWHRTLNEYVIVGNEHLSANQLEQTLAQSLDELLFERPSWAKQCAGRPPAFAYSELFTPARSFQADHELAHFDLGRVDTYLAKLSWRRRASSTGQVTIGQRRKYTIGRQRANKEVLVRFDPKDRHFVFFDVAEPDNELVRHPARGLEISDLTGIDEWPFGRGIQQLPLPFANAERVSC
jgi:transposase InsO family protein